MVTKALAKIRARENMDNWLGDTGKVVYALMWLVGVPLPVLILFYFIFGH